MHLDLTIWKFNMTSSQDFHLQGQTKAQLMGGQEPSIQEEDMWFRERNRSELCFSHAKITFFIMRKSRLWLLLS